MFARSQSQCSIAYVQRLGHTIRPSKCFKKVGTGPTPNMVKLNEVIELVSALQDYIYAGCGLLEAFELITVC